MESVERNGATLQKLLENVAIGAVTAVLHCSASFFQADCNSERSLKGELRLADSINDNVVIHY